MSQNHVILLSTLQCTTRIMWCTNFDMAGVVPNHSLPFCTYRRKWLWFFKMPLPPPPRLIHSLRHQHVIYWVCKVSIIENIRFLDFSMTFRWPRLPASLLFLLVLARLTSCLQNNYSSVKLWKCFLQFLNKATETFFFVFARFLSLFLRVFEP